VLYQQPLNLTTSYSLLTQTAVSNANNELKVINCGCHVSFSFFDSHTTCTQLRRPFLLSLILTYVARTSIFGTKHQRFLESTHRKVRRQISVDRLFLTFSYRPQQISPPWDEDWQLDGNFLRISQLGITIIKIRRFSEL